MPWPSSSTGTSVCSEDEPVPHGLVDQLGPGPVDPGLEAAGGGVVDNLVDRPLRSRYPGAGTTVAATRAGHRA